MSNLNMKLQLRSHKEIFPTRDEAVKYIYDEFAPDALFGEPTVYFYGKRNKPSVIVAIGSNRGKISLIDFDELKEEITNISADVDRKLEKGTDAYDTVMSLIKATGLKYDTNRITDKVSYTPKDRRDVIYGNAESLIDAIDLISKYIQREFVPPILKDSNTIEFSQVVEGRKEKTIANVRVSNYGYSDTVNFNNNIIGVKNDGIYATSNLEYNEETNVLTFTSSGLKDGIFLDDAKRKDIRLSGNKNIKKKDGNNKTIDLSIEKVGENVVLDANVKISKENGNLLSVNSDGLYISSENVVPKVDNKPVSEVIQKIKETLDETKRDTIISGEETDTSEVIVRKNRNGGYTIANNVRLSRDSSIDIKNGGLSVNADVSLDTLTNTLNFTIGSHNKKIKLPGLSVIRSVTYDKRNKALSINVDDNTTPLVIPVGDMLKNIDVKPNQTSSVVLLKQEDSDLTANMDLIHAMLRLRSHDNLLVEENGHLYVSKSEVNSLITNKTDELDNKISEAKNSIRDIDLEQRQLKEAIRTDLIKNNEKIVELDTKFTEKLNAESEKIKTKLGNDLSGLETKLNEFKQEQLGKENTINNEINTIKNTLPTLSTKLTPNNDVENPIKLSIEENQIKAKLDISRDNTNLILNQNGVLYASNDVEHHYGYWAEDTTQKLNLQLILNKINNRLERLETETAKIASLNDRLLIAQNSINSIKEVLGNYTNSSTITTRLNEIDRVISELIDFGTY